MSSPGKGAAQELAAARAGSADALGQILDACRAYLLRIARQELAADLQAKGGASDLVQQTMCDAVRDFGQFVGESDGELEAWLHRLLLNNLVDFTRLYRETGKREIGREVPLKSDSSSGGLAAGLAGQGASPSGVAINHEKAAAIRQALERLPENYSRVIKLRYEEERTFEEIGQMMDLTPNAARKLWARALKRLQQETGELP
jgi:RNA polymerase sigma-70 factor (ECF subfamily)